jgi:hypothetical protein
VATTPPGGSEHLGASGTIPARLPQHAVRAVLGAERRQAARLGAQARAENTPDRVEGGPHRRRRQATRVEQGVLNVAREAVARTDVGLDDGDGHHPMIAPLLQPPPQERMVSTVGTTVLLAVWQNVIHAWCVEVRGHAGLALEPAAAVGEPAHRRLRRPDRIALGQHLWGTGVQMRTHRTCGQRRQDHGMGTPWVAPACRLDRAAVDHREKTSRIMQRSQVLVPQITSWKSGHPRCSSSFHSA